MNKQQIQHCREVWVPALRSGEYGQAIGQLYISDVNWETGFVNEEQFCCLGVACQVFPGEISRDWKQQTTVSNKIVQDYFGIAESSMELPEGFDPYGHIPEQAVITALDDTKEVSLGELNDECHWNFDQIADLIEVVCQAWEVEIEQAAN